MKAKRKLPFQRVLTTIMAVVLVLGLTPAGAWAATADSNGGGDNQAAAALTLSTSGAALKAQAAADPIDVYMTVSNKGTLALARELVTVEDADANGAITLDEALQAAHAKYCPGGYATGPSYYGGLMVTKLWGVETTNTTFSKNDAMTNSVDAETVSAGDDIVAAVQKDDVYYSDHYTYFDKKQVSIKAGEAFDLVLSARTWGDPMVAPDIQVGTWKDGAFTALEGKKTGADGKVTLSFDKPGTYVVSAAGTISDDVTVDWTTYATEKMDCPITAPVCIVTVAARDVDVYMTVSNKGTLALARELVTVEDADANGAITLDEALQAAHAKYCPGGYATGPSYYGGLMVTKLWGVETTNTTFSKNDAMTNSVDAETVSAGDDIVAAVQKDDVYYSDHYAFFDKKQIAVFAGASFDLVLSARTWGDPMVAPDIQVGTWKDGAFTALEGKKTGADGKVTLSFDKPGTYVVSAAGTINDDVTVDWTTYATEKMDCPITAPVCIVGVADPEAVAKAQEAVAAIPKDPNGDDAETVAAARQAYDALSDAEKEFIDEKVILRAELAVVEDVITTSAKAACAMAEIPYDEEKSAVQNFFNAMAVAIVNAYIEATPIDLSDATMTVKNATYTGKPLTPVVTVTLDGKALVEGTDYSLAYADNTNAGTGVAIVKGIEKYTGGVYKTFTISKAKNPLVVKSAKASYKASQLKKASKSFTPKVIKTKGAGTVTYAKKSVTAKYKKYITVSTKGKVTVAKGAPKGKCVLKLKVKAAGNSNYKAATKYANVTITIK